MLDVASDVASPWRFWLDCMFLSGRFCERLMTSKYNRGHAFNFDACAAASADRWCEVYVLPAVSDDSMAGTTEQPLRQRTYVRIPEFVMNSYQGRLLEE
jgi:hypothetical protein